MATQYTINIDKQQYSLNMYNDLKCFLFLINILAFILLFAVYTYCNTRHHLCIINLISVPIVNLKISLKCFYNYVLIISFYMLIFVIPLFRSDICDVFSINLFEVTTSADIKTQGNWQFIYSLHHTWLQFAEK